VVGLANIEEEKNGGLFPPVEGSDCRLIR